MTIEANHLSFTGEDITYRMTVVDSGGTAQNILGWTFQAQWRRTVAASSADLDYATGGSGIVINDATNGIIDITIPGTATTDLDPGEFSYGVNRTNSGSEAVLANGRWRFLRGVVR